MQGHLTVAHVIASAGSAMTKSFDQRKIVAATEGRRRLAEPLPGGKPIITGIQYVTDENGRKVAVQIDLKKHRELWEDIQDVLVSQSRRHEKRIPLDKVKAGLVKSGKLQRG